MDIPKILIVDDEKHIRQSLEDYLSKRIECDILTACNGYEAIKKLQEDSLDLIILDITMPGISGTEVIQKAKSISKNIPIIVITKWDSTTVANQIKDSGAEYIPKPFSLKFVLGKVKEKLEASGKFTPKHPG